MRKILIGLLCFLSPLTDLKLGAIQPVEMLTVFLLPIVLYNIFSTLEIKSSSEVISLLRKYMGFIVVVILLSIYSMRLKVYLPPDITMLRTPPYLSMAKVFQLSVIIMTMFIMIFWFVKKPALINFFARWYIYVGLFSAVFALVSYVAMFGGIELGGAYAIESPRAKGFFVEGGPFGMYLVSVLLVVIFRREVLKEGSLLEMTIYLGVLMTAFFASQSKAGFLLVMLLVVYFSIVKEKSKYFFSAILVMLPLLFVTGKIDGISGYIYNYNNFFDAAAERSDDNSLVMGRLMASVLVPRMVMDQPLTGIGLGNYSLQRNNPEYLEGLPTTDYWDLPGLGLLGYTAELGLPLTFFLAWLLWIPVRKIRKMKLPPILAVLASYQFFAFFLGVQITFIYPWLIAALALGFAFRQRLATPEVKSTSQASAVLP